MFLSKIKTIAWAALAISSIGGAQAAAQLTATFRDPVGTVLATDAIDVWIKLTNVGDEAFTFDRDVGPEANYGMPSPFSLPSVGSNIANSLSNVPFESYDRVSLFVFGRCTETFTTGCNAAGAYVAQVPAGQGWFAVGSRFTLDPSASLEMPLFTLTPDGGTAAAGSYIAYNVGVGVFIYGKDADGNTLQADLLRIGTCPTSDVSCAFQRTVVAVPEPDAVAMMLTGLLPIAAAVRRQRRRR
ncbi:PEP-CTERM sorting domain-containing protein [Aquabacterium sp. OR-4]|uniref:PEP-CTERM sorting domain-containing protein n=1 Tax=Aquabacterium sp. OR-4 TaxID=2978127 RepID=UPI0028C8E283|nr:PEP-CTERM sorting domain-containing protein [Aquabacterium sp. OR-4]MDT7838757.1 PEP-CTERM sorting domain-containing protein [Aquabacterium sp. OR-4]